MTSITLALWTIALSNLICAAFWAYQTYTSRKWRKVDNNRNDALAQAQLTAQELSNQAIRQQIELFKIQTEASALDLNERKVQTEVESADQRQANAARMILERKERIESEIDSLVAAEQSKCEQIG